MRTRRLDETHVKFSAVESGDVFLFDGDLFIKTEEPNVAIYLDSGSRHTFDGAVRVVLADGEFVWSLTPVSARGYRTS